MQKNDRLNRLVLVIAALAVVMLAATGCAQRTDHTKGVYMLIDTSGTYTEELNKARAIIKYRKRAKFKATYAVIRVRGIGRKTYRKLRPYLTVKGPTTLTNKVRRRADR